MSIKFFKDQTLQELLENIGNNLDCYRNGDFSDLITPESCHQSSELSFDHEILRSIGGGLENDAENCIKMFDALEGLTPKLAREKRLWCYLTHTDLLEYTRERWPIPDDDDEAITKIQNHFFIKTSRNYERDNAASRLWWSAFICKRAPTIDTKKALEAMLFKPDARGQLVDRTTTAVSIDLFEAILEKIVASFEGDQEFLKKRHAVNRPFMVEVNAFGGYNLLNALSLKQSRECLKMIDQKLFSKDSSEDLIDTEKDLDNDANVEVWGTGNPLREFIHVDDVADACLYLMNNIDADELYNSGISHINIGSGEEVSIKELAIMIKKVIDYKGDLVFNSDYPDGTPRKLLDVSRLNAMGWKSKIKLEDGLKSVYEWYLDKLLKD